MCVCVCVCDSCSNTHATELTNAVVKVEDISAAVSSPLILASVGVEYGVQAAVLGAEAELIIVVVFTGSTNCGATIRTINPIIPIAGS